MSQELIFTSLPKGLKPGASGFSTVAQTAGMSPVLTRSLEGLSAYRFLYKLNDPQAEDLSPVNYMHLKVRAGTGHRSLLSRVAFAGSDYTGRANKLAHHFLLEPSETLPQGPADMMQGQKPDLFFSRYEQAPQELSPRGLETLSPTGSRSSIWQAATGDQGWAGALACAFRSNPKTPSFLVYPPGTDVLSLFAESLQILTPEERWQVTFCTYYGVQFPPDVTCCWYGIVADTPQQAEISRYPHATVLDLTKKLMAPPDNEYTDAARNHRSLPVVSIATPQAVSQTPEDTAHGESRDLPEPGFRPTTHRSVARAIPRRAGRPWLVTGIIAAILLAVGGVAVVFLQQSDNYIMPEDVATTQPTSKPVTFLEGEPNPDESEQPGKSDPEKTQSTPTQQAAPKPDEPQPPEKITEPKPVSKFEALMIELEAPGYIKDPKRDMSRLDNAEELAGDSDEKKKQVSKLRKTIGETDTRRGVEEVLSKCHQLSITDEKFETQHKKCLRDLESITSKLPKDLRGRIRAAKKVLEAKKKKWELGRLFSSEEWGDLECHPSIIRTLEKTGSTILLEDQREFSFKVADFVGWADCPDAFKRKTKHDKPTRKLTVSERTKTKSAPLNLASASTDILEASYEEKNETITVSVRNQKYLNPENRRHREVYGIGVVCQSKKDGKRWLVVLRTAAPKGAKYSAKRKFQQIVAKGPQKVTMTIRLPGKTKPLAAQPLLAAQIEWPDGAPARSILKKYPLTYPEFNIAFPGENPFRLKIDLDHSHLKPVLADPKEETRWGKFLNRIQSSFEEQAEAEKTKKKIDKREEKGKKPTGEEKKILKQGKKATAWLDKLKPRHDDLVVRDLWGQELLQIKVTIEIKKETK